MNTLTYTFSLGKDIIRILPEKDFFFDIETTGLSKIKTILYMIGAAYRKGNDLHIIQWFNDDAVSEPEILRTFSSFLEDFSGNVYTFNGESFDLPYLKLHYEFNEIENPLNEFHSVDLYRVLKPFQHAFLMEHGKQKDWEAFMGIHRDDRYNGGELIKVYRQYLKTKDEDLKKLLLLHNMEDVRGMSHLLTLLSYESLIKGSFVLREISAISEEELITEKDELSKDEYQVAGYAVPSSDQKIPVEHPGEYLKLNFHLSLPVPTPFLIDAPYGMINVKKDQLILILPCYEGELKHFFPNYKDYYYLPEEDTAVHMSVGCFVDPKHRKKAKVSTCYVRKTGCFLAFPKTQKHYGFRIDTSGYEDQYILYRKSHQHMIRYINFEDMDFESLLSGEQTDSIMRKYCFYFSDVIKEILISYLDGHIIS